LNSRSSATAERALEARDDENGDRQGAWVSIVPFNLRTVASVRESKGAGAIRSAERGEVGEPTPFGDLA
jgi:hypothetical protein